MSQMSKIFINVSINMLYLHLLTGLKSNSENY